MIPGQLIRDLEAMLAAGGECESHLGRRATARTVREGGVSHHALLFSETSVLAALHDPLYLYCFLTPSKCVRRTPRLVSPAGRPPLHVVLSS